MQKINRVEHDGIVKSISNDKVEVSIVSHAACASCNLKGSCSMSEIEEKIIEVKRVDGFDYREGERVNVFFKQSLGFRALFLGYLMPFILVMIMLIVGEVLQWSEIKSGGLALGTLPFYYLALWLTREKMRGTFNFSVEKK